MKNKIQKITPNLWFDTQSEEAVKLYTSIFKNSKIGRITHYRKERNEIHGIQEGTVMTVERVMKALLQTKNKIDIKTLMQAYEG